MLSSMNTLGNSPLVIETEMEQPPSTEACRIRRDSVGADCSHEVDEAYQAANVENVSAGISSNAVDH